MLENPHNNFAFPRNIQRKYFIWSGCTLAALVALKLIVSLLSRSFLIVNPGERGLIINLGKLQEEVLDEGTYTIVPFISSTKIIDIRIQKTDIESTARTKDLQRINTQVTLNWQIDPSKVRDIYQRIGTKEDIISKIINPAFDETIKISIPSRTLEKVLAEREQIKEEIKSRITKRLEPYGLLVTDVAFVNLSASEEFTKATEARQVAEQQAIAAKIVAEQEIQEAELKAIKAKKEAEALVYKAKGEAEAQKLLQQTLTPQL